MSNKQKTVVAKRESVIKQVSYLLMELGKFCRNLFLQLAENRKITKNVGGGFVVVVVVVVNLSFSQTKIAFFS